MASRPIHHVGIDHCRFHVFVPQQFSHGSYIRTRFQQVCGETVTQGMAPGMLGDSGELDRLFHRSL